jgi:carboxyl-terminal processing protease
MKLLKGPKGTEVKIGVYRPTKEKELEFNIKRDQIPIKSVDVSYMVNDEVGYIKISRFSRNTHEEFLEGARMLQAKGMKELIIDLRNNGGGYMESAINIADELLSEGKMIVYTEGRARPKQSYFATDAGTMHDVPVAILIDEGSASASEILAGAVQDNDRGVILGRRSFGKGLVQEQNSWPDGSATRLTIARYYTPTGRCIQKPYDDGIEAYHKDIVNRYENGELVNSDSIDFPDSLKYKTPEGKVVYGGGGIMPDIYIGLDTVGSSFLLSELYYKAIFYHFTFDYTDHHRTDLESFESPEAFKSNWKVTDEVLNSFRAFAEERGVQYDREQEKASLDLIKQRIKAGIARNLFGSEGFYPIFNESDKVVNKAVEVIEEVEA